MSETGSTNGACALSRYITAVSVTIASRIESLPRNGPGASRVRGIPGAVFNLGAMMKMQMLGVLVIGSLLTSSTWGDDLPKMGYTPATSVNELVAKGYRWVTVNGPYACVTEQELRQVTGGHTDLTELHMVEDGDAYYLIPGMLVRVVRDDQVNGMAEIRLGGITSPRWTYTRFLSARPIRDIYGVIETPDIAGLVDTSDAAGKELRSEGPTTASQIVMSPRTLQQGIKIGERNAKQVAGQ